MRRLLILAAAAGLSGPASADVKPHVLFTDDMVLQRGGECPVWGTADPDEQVTVKLTRQTTTGVEMSSVSTTADKDGKWTAKVDAIKPGPGCTLTIKGKNEVVLKNVAVGDVWVCSGQSNMEWRISQLGKEGQNQKVAAAANHPNIRLFTVRKTAKMAPETTVPVMKVGKDDKNVWDGKWQAITNPDVALYCTAVGYFFGRELEKNLNVPIGLLHTAWGGTPAQAWVSKETLASVPELKYYADQLNENTKPGGGTPAALYNGMIAPLLPFAIKGAIWYQGESNAGKAAEYRTLMPTLIKDWRAKWGKDFPFFMVQLAPFQGGKSGVDYAELRDAQVHTTKVLKGVGIAVITDVGDKTDIHPQKKEPVGARLALAARAIAYGEKVEYSGPMYKSQKVDGGKVTLTFDHVGKGLECKGEKLEGFQVCGADGKFMPAKAEIVGDTVVVSSPDVPAPTAVRFGWVNFAEPTLNFFNKDGLPAVPFRTDDFPLTTAKK